MTGNNIILRIVKDGVTHDQQVDKNVPLRVDMSTLESQQIGKLFGIGSQEFNIPGTNQSNAFFDFAFNPARINIGSIGVNKFDFSGAVSPVYIVFKAKKNWHWYLDGEEIDVTDIPSYEIAWEDEGEYELCVDVSNICLDVDEDPEINCVMITVVASANTSRSNSATTAELLALRWRSIC